MKGAFLISLDEYLSEHVRASMTDLGAEFFGDETARLRDEQGRLFTVFLHRDPTMDWEWRAVPSRVIGEDAPPDLERAVACWIECRWEDFFAAAVCAIAGSWRSQTWVLDGDGVLWSAAAVDPQLVRL